MDERDRTATIRKAAKEIRRLTVNPLKDAVAGQTQGAEAVLRDIQQKATDALAQLRDPFNHISRRMGTEEDISFTPEGKVRFHQARSIHKWDPGNGHIIYTFSTINSPSRVTSDDLKSLSLRITVQQATFGELTSAEQSKLSSVFKSSKGRAADIQPYRDYLQSEALGRRFEELKQNPPRPFVK